MTMLPLPYTSREILIGSYTVACLSMLWTALSSSCTLFCLRTNVMTTTRVVIDRRTTPAAAAIAIKITDLRCWSSSSCSQISNLIDPGTGTEIFVPLDVFPDILRSGTLPSEPTFKRANCEESDSCALNNMVWVHFLRKDSLKLARNDNSCKRVVRLEIFAFTFDISNLKCASPLELAIRRTFFVVSNTMGVQNDAWQLKDGKHWTTLGESNEVASKITTKEYIVTVKLITRSTKINFAVESREYWLFWNESTWTRSEFLQNVSDEFKKSTSRAKNNWHQHINWQNDAQMLPKVEGIKMFDMNHYFSLI